MPKCMGCRGYSRELYEAKNLKHNLVIHLCKKCIENNVQNQEAINDVIQSIIETAEQNISFFLD